MTFSATLPLSGYAGWAFLKRTTAAQMKVLQADPVAKRDEAYFREKISSIDSAEKLVADKRLLRVALTAFGLQDDIGSSFFIRKVLESDTSDATSLANKLADKQYLALATAFGFGTKVATQGKGFADTILSAYEARSFEVAVGEQDDSLRLALNAERELPALAAKTSKEDTKWYTVLGNEPLRTVFQKAFGLPTSFSALDIDTQLEMIKAKADDAFGSSDIAQFADSEKVGSLIKKYLLRSQVDDMLTQTRQSGALTMLQQTAELLRGR